MSIPEDLRYTKDHEWVKLDGNVATVGITFYAQGELGDIVFIELPAVGDAISQSEPFGTIEAVKAVSDLFAPVSGKVVQINESLNENPEAVNKDPYGDGWMIKVELSDSAELENLLDAKGYEGIIGE